MRLLTSTRLFLPTFALGFVLVLASALGAGDLPDIGGKADRWFEALTIEGTTYRDVTVYSQSDTDVMLRHEQGLTGLKVADLDNPTLRRLGYRVDDPEPEAGVTPMDGLGYLSGFIQSDRFRQIGTLTLIGLVIVTVGVYLYTSYLFWLICVKTETAPGIAVWLPIVQIFPLFRAARLSRAWAAVVILLPVGAGILLPRWPEYALGCELVMGAIMVLLWAAWSIKICHARGKSVVVVVLLLLPGVNYLALLYLAGSK
jgi:hypothetical protein